MPRSRVWKAIQFAGDVGRIALTVLVVPFVLVPFFGGPALGIIAVLWEGKPKPPASPEPEPRPLLPSVGTLGRARSVLSPAGVVEVGGQLYQARNVWSIFVSPDRPVKVVEVDGETFLVEEVDDTGDAIRG